MSLREEQLARYVSRLRNSSSQDKRHDGWIELNNIPTGAADAEGSRDKDGVGALGSSIQPRQGEDGCLEGGPLLPGGVFVSRGTLLQRCHTQDSNLTDVNGAAVKVQVQLLQQVLGSTIPRQVFEHCYRLGVPEGPDVARALEKRRIQNSLRRVKEHLEVGGHSEPPVAAGANLAAVA